MCAHSVAALAVWVWRVSFPTASHVWCSAVCPTLSPVPRVILAGVSRTIPVYRSQVWTGERRAVWVILITVQCATTVFVASQYLMTWIIFLVCEILSCLFFSVVVVWFSWSSPYRGQCVRWYNSHRVLYNKKFWPLAERSACRVDQISGAYGWWGERTSFLTSLPSCRTENYVPGLHLLTFQHPRNQSQPDKVCQDATLTYDFPAGYVQQSHWTHVLTLLSFLP